jgi:hypothetical protein
LVSTAIHAHALACVFDDVIEADPDRLREVNGIGAVRASNHRATSARSTSGGWELRSLLRRCHAVPAFKGPYVGSWPGYFGWRPFSMRLTAPISVQRDSWASLALESSRTDIMVAPRP